MKRSLCEMDTKQTRTLHQILVECQTSSTTSPHCTLLLQASYFIVLQNFVCGYNWQQQSIFLI